MLAVCGHTRVNCNSGPRLIQDRTTKTPRITGNHPRSAAASAAEPRLRNVIAASHFSGTAFEFNRISSKMM